MHQDQPDSAGKIFRTLKDGLPILWTLVPEMPPERVRLALPWMVAISWKYDGSSREGMPPPDANSAMQSFEQAISELEQPESCFEAYRRVGNHLREVVLYVASTKDFMVSLNARLAGHPRYPIDIRFYEDPAWSELQELINDLSPSSGTEAIRPQ